MELDSHERGEPQRIGSPEDLLLPPHTLSITFVRLMKQRWNEQSDEA